MPASASADECRFRGEPAIALTAGSTTALFVPRLGMTGVSLRCRGAEHLALPGGLDALRAGRTTGLPLLAPWANRLSQRRYRAAGVEVDLAGRRLGVDDNGLPIHGLLVGRDGWSVDRLATRGNTASLRASIAVDAPAFPFPHRIEVAAIVRDAQLRVDTTIVPTGRRPVPVAFGWHPYLRVPGARRSQWRLRLPPRLHRVLDDRGIPNGAAHKESAEAEPVGRRTFDDLYGLGRDRRLAFRADGGHSVELHCGKDYPFAQVWVPKGRPFAALEPMAAPTNALVSGGTPMALRGEPFTATFALNLDRSN
jgi:galactose mutarotase-like enzyme